MKKILSILILTYFVGVNCYADNLSQASTDISILRGQDGKKRGEDFINETSGTLKKGLIFSAALMAGIAIAPAIVNAIKDNVELNFKVNNQSLRTIYYDRNDWIGWDSDKNNKGCTNCKGSILPGQSASASTGSNKKGASIGWNIGYNPDFSVDKISYVRVWKQTNKSGGLNIQSGNTPYNVNYAHYATVSAADDSIYYLVIGNDVPTTVNISTPSCLITSSGNKEVCNTEVSVYGATENIPPATKTYTADGTNNVEILASSNFALNSGEAIRVQAGASSSRYGNKYKAYELLNLSTDNSTLKLKFMGCNDILCATNGNTLWENNTNVSQLSESSIPAGTYKLALQNDGNIVDYDASGKALGALW